MNTILGKKVGMTQIFSETGEAIPVTVIEAGPVAVTQIKTTETDGYEAVQIGYVDEKAHRVTKPMKGHFEKAGVAAKKHLAEVRVENASEYSLNQEYSKQARSLISLVLQKVRVLRVTSRDTDTTEVLWVTVQSTRDLPAVWLQVLILQEYSRVTMVLVEWVVKLLQYRTSNS